MGKKSKKSYKMADIREPLPNEEPLEHEAGEKLDKTKKKKSHNSLGCSDNNNVFCDDIIAVKISKKKKHTRALDTEVNEDSKLEQATSNEKIKSVEDDHNPPNLKVKRKKKEKRHLLHEQEPSEATYHVINNDGPHVPKKKKNKCNLLTEEQITQDIDQVHSETTQLESQVHKKTKKSDVANGNETEQRKTNDNIRIGAKEQKTRSQKKKRTGTAVLNDEESQVMEEDIDKFCDEIDEEDNKQYEEWVKLIEANLPPPRENN